MTEHPITPPPELVQQWCHEDGDEIKTSPRWYQIVATKAARWGADQELEACCDHMRDHQWGFVERSDGTKIHRAVYLQQSRRPQPTILAKRALHILGTHGDLSCAEHDTIRRALEALDD